MAKTFISYIPWVLYFIFVNSLYISYEVAAIVSLVATIVFCGRNLRKKFIMDYGTFIYFSALSIFCFLPISTWLNQYAALLANVFFSLIMWFSIIINKPFTIQYAKEETPEFVWATPGFKFVNVVISCFWAITTSLMAVDGILQSSGIIGSVWINDAIVTLLIILAVVFTKEFPDWYQGHLFRQKSQTLEDIASNPFLNGNYAPVKDELFISDLTVEGKIPDDLMGVYMRNGPNPEFHPISYTYPIDGDGMIHAVYINEGKATYRNRFVETKGLLAERKAGKALYGGIDNIIPTDPKLIGKDGDPGPTKNGAFVHIIRHANQYLAILEAAEAYQLSSDLHTIKKWTPRGRHCPPEINAHTRLDPISGHLSLITYDFLSPPYLTYYELNEKGDLIKELPIEKPYSTMMHDFATTENYIVFFDCPAVFNTHALTTGDPILSWRPELKTRIGIMKKSDNTIEWIETDTFWVYHFVNAYEKDNQIVVDYIRHAELALGAEITHEDRAAPSLYRAVIDGVSKKVSHKQLDTRVTEFPRINELMNSKIYRYAYMPTKIKGESFDALIKYDLETKTSVVHDFGEFREIGEPVFAPKTNAVDEDEGYVMLFTYDRQTNSSDFVILDAQDFSGQPLAIVKLPRRVPHGLHGSWMEGPW